MRRKLLVALSALAVLTAALVGGMTLTSGAAAATRMTYWNDDPRTIPPETASAAATGADIILILREANFSFVDVGTPGESPGDYFVFYEDVLKADESRKVGSAIVQCVLDFSQTVICDGSLLLANRGEIVVFGRVKFDETTFDLPITGGTGEFDGASGHITVEELQRNRERLKVFFA